LAEQLTLNQWVPGSSPGGCTKNSLFQVLVLLIFNLGEWGKMQTKFKITAQLVISIFVFSGCAPAFNEETVATCDGIRSNLSALRELPTPLKEYEFASDQYMVSNVGDDRRAEFALIVNEVWPWIPTYADYSVSGFYYLGVEAELWEIATQGTPVAYVLPESEKKRLNEDENENDTNNNNLFESIDSIIGQCYEYDAERTKDQPTFSTDTTEDAWNESFSLAQQIAGQYNAVSECIATGMRITSICAKDDYVSTWDWSDYQVEQTNPWDREWSTDWMEGIAKTAWCISNGYRDYSSNSDACVS